MSTFKINIIAGPLWSNDEAQKLGGRIAAAHRKVYRTMDNHCRRTNERYRS